MASGLRRNVGYNTAKLRALEVLEREPMKWWTVYSWAGAAGIYPKRRMYTYAIRLARYDLVTRAIIGGRLSYRIAPTGLKRLLWLRRPE